MTQERQDGWYWTRSKTFYPEIWCAALYDAETKLWYSNLADHYYDNDFAEIGPRIPSPDEPNALLDVAQKAQELMLAIDHDYQALRAQVVIAAKAGTLREALAKLEGRGS